MIQDLYHLLLQLWQWHIELDRRDQRQALPVKLAKEHLQYVLADRILAGGEVGAGPVLGRAWCDTAGIERAPVTTSRDDGSIVAGMGEVTDQPFSTLVEPGPALQVGSIFRTDILHGPEIFREKRLVEASDDSSSVPGARVGDHPPRRCRSVIFPKIAGLSAWLLVTKTRGLLVLGQKISR